jgi:hypothetical protein
VTGGKGDCTTLFRNRKKPEPGFLVILCVWRKPLV